MNSQKSKSIIDRRGFLHSAAVAGAGLALSGMQAAEGAGVAISGTAIARKAGKKPDDLNIALLGAGMQGQTLMNICFKIPGVRFKAVCDIWTKHNLKRASGTMKTYRQENNAYTDYREMLEKEKDLDAVIIATPDFWHAEHTVACLKAGLHVYCEKEMSNTLEGARKMVVAAKETGKLLQIGHQRRSNPRYRFCHAAILGDAKLLGRIAAVNGQWNRSPSPGRPASKKLQIDADTLGRYGYESMRQFREWRWYKKLGGGPIVDLGSHQIDIFTWFLGANPKSVMASGRHNYYDKKSHEWYDTVMAIYEYETPAGSATAFYQTVSSSGAGGYFETFMGDEGSMIISESHGRCELYPNMQLRPDWTKWIRKGYLYKQCDEEIECIEKAKELCIKQCGCEQIKEKDTGFVIDARESIEPPKYELPVVMNKKAHQPHLENFFDAIRTGGTVKLTCPAEIGYETAVAVLKVNEAVEAGRRIEFKPGEFEV